jgi:hypothetical protein
MNRQGDILGSRDHEPGKQYKERQSLQSTQGLPLCPLPSSHEQAGQDKALTLK